ncbi:MAG: two-component system, NtrC family, sensor kinase [Acidobacteriota bacterium]|jgi:signal transduction histidine kinase
MTRGITSRFVLLIATAAVLPLVVYGLVSVESLRRGTEQSVSRGNQEVARQIAKRIGQYFDNNVRVLSSIGEELNGTGLQPWQRARILRNHVLDFPEFREISVFDVAGRVLATSRPGVSTLTIPESVGTGETVTTTFYVATPHIDTDALPTTTLAVPLMQRSDTPGWIVAEISLEELWRTVDKIKVGNMGYALLLDEQARFLAHGNPNDKKLIASGAAPAEQKLAATLHQPGTAFESVTFRNDRNEQLLAVAADVGRPQWTVLVEQPTSDAFEVTNRLERQLLAAIGLAMLGTVVLGWLWGRSFIQRIFALTRAARAIADGHMDERVAPSGQDEIRQLGDAFNSMADRLVELQENVRKQERQAMFGRIAAGLVHDLSHPIQNIGNSCKLIQKMYEDIEYRETFRKTVERELVIVKRVLDDLRNIARPIPLERFAVDLNRTVADAAEAMEPHAETAGLTLRTELTPETVFIEGDVFALGRVYRNLILNAIQATAPGGLIVVATEAQADRVQVRIYDTGCGIPAERVSQIFEDFVTTKRRGLGLGLAISKKIVEQLGGTITVASEVGKGTTFVLDFPRTTARPMLVAG